MKLIIGLGNPGEKYKNNRHNVGFMFVDYLVNTLTSSRVHPEQWFHRERVNGFKYDKYLLSTTYSLLPNIVLAKPQKFMNKSGEAVSKLIKNFIPHFAGENLIVVHDDLDIPFGMFKIHREGPKLHNGIESIEKTLGTKDFLRVRIGVDNRTSNKRINGETYVLQNFLPDEKEKLTEVFSSLARQMNPYLDLAKK